MSPGLFKPLANASLWLFSSSPPLSLFCNVVCKGLCSAVPVSSPLAPSVLIDSSCGTAASRRVPLMVISYNPLRFWYYYLLPAFPVVLPGFNLSLTGLSYPNIMLFLFNMTQENAKYHSFPRCFEIDGKWISAEQFEAVLGDLRCKLSTLLPLETNILRKKSAGC